MTKLPRILLAAALLSCDGDGGSSGIDSGLPSEKKGSEFTPDDEAALCNSFSKYYLDITADSSHHLQCVIEGYYTGDGTSMSCQTVYDTCIKEEPEPREDVGVCEFRFDFATCTATVAQLEACLKAQSDAAAVASEAASCADLSKPPGDYPAPAACSEIEPICPGASS